MQARRQMSRRAFLSESVLGVAGVAILAACGPAAQPTPTVGAAKPADTPKPAATAATGAVAKPTTAPKPAGAAKPTGPVTISIATRESSESGQKLWNQLVETFQKKNPNVTVKIDLSSATGEYDQKLFAQLAGGTLPDIVRTADNYVQPFKENKITQDMIPFAKATGFPYQEFDKAFLDLGMVDGELHMLPRSGDVVVLFINKRMVQEAGVEIPWTLDPASKQWTKDEFYKVCQRLTVDVNGKRGDEAGFDKKNVAVYGAAVRNNWWAVYVPAVLSEGGEFVASDLSKSLLDSEAGVKAFEWLTKPILDGYWAPTSLINTIGDANVAWAGGKAAITMTVRGGIPGFRDTITDDWDVAHFPMGSVKRVTGMGTFGYGLSASSKAPEVAWSFLEWLFGEEGMSIIAQNYGAVPPQKRFYKAGFWRELPPPPSNNDVFVDAFAYGTMPPRLPFYTTGAFTKAVNDGLQAVELGKATPQDVVKTIHGELNKWLQSSQKK